MDQLTKSKENSAFYRCAPLVVALCLIMVAGCCSTSNRPKFLQRLQNREEVDSRVNDSQKDSPSRSSDPLKEKETVGSRSLTAQSDSGDRSQYVDNAAAKDTSNAGSNQAINAPYRSYAPSVDQADRQPTLNEYQIPDPTPLSTQGIPQTAQTIEASQTQPASEPTPEPAPVASEPQESTPAPEPQPSEPEASSVPTPPVVSDPEPSPEPQPKEQESSVPTPPTTFEPASVKTEQPIAQDQADAEPQTPEQVEAAAPVTSGLQGDATIGDLAKEATANAESPESAEPASSEASAPEAVPAEAPAPTAEAAPVETPEPAAEPAPVDSTDDSNWEQKYSANKTGRNVQLKNAVYSRVRSGNAKSSGSVKMKSTAQRVEVPKTASVVVERVAPIVPVQSNVVTKTEEYVDASKYRGRRAR